MQTPEGFEQYLQRLPLQLHRVAAIKGRDAEIRREERTPAAADVLAERRRQVDVEGWTPEHDDKHARGQLAGAAACYAYGEMIRPDTGAILWHLDEEWWKPGDRRRELVKAGALILAEIERLDRASAPAGKAAGEIRSMEFHHGEDDA